MIEGIVEKCSYCGSFFVKKSNAQKYCSEHCKHEAQLESKRKYINKRNLKKQFNTRIKNLTTLGSLGTDCSYHMKSDFSDEAKSVKSQLRMLRIQ